MQQQPADLAQQNGNVQTGAPSSPGSQGAGGGGGATTRGQISGGRFDFEDGGTFCGGWEDSKAHGHGVCTGPKNQGAYSGAWNYGFEVSGVYTWPSGSSFEGQWQNGKRHGLGVETRGRWLYRGEWTQGFKGRYGVRQSTSSNARYEGTWANGLQDGYGSETYADGGTYQGQWLRGMRHGYGVRTSAPFGLASRFKPKSIRTSLTSLRSNEAGAAPTPDPAEKRNHRIDDSRGGFVLKAKSDEPPPRRNSLVEKTKKGLLSGLKIRKQRSTGDLEKRGTGSGSIRSTASTASWMSTESSQSGITNKSVHTDSNASFVVEEGETLDGSVTETYMGEWKNDKRCGYGISERSDGLKYEGEWFANKKYGYGVTTFKDGTKEEGKYKNNVLITSQKKKHLFLIRSAKFRERIDAAVNSAQRASKYALQKADIAISRTATSRGKAELADISAENARVDSDLAIATAREFAPDFKPSLLERFEKIRIRDRYRMPPPDPSPGLLKPHGVDHNQLGVNKSSLNLQQQQQQQQHHHQQQQQTSTPSRRPSTMQHQQQSQQSMDYTQMNSLSPTAAASMDYGSQQNSYSNQFAQSQPPGSNYSTPQKYPQQQAAAGGGLQSNQSFYNNNNNNNNNNSNLSSNSQQLQQQMPNSYDPYGNNKPQNTFNQMENQYYQQQQQQQVPPRRSSRQVSDSGRPMLGAIAQQSSIDHFDHYKRPPSRDSSVDRYARAASRMSGSRQPSVDRTMGAAAAVAAPQVAAALNSIETPDRNMRAGSQFRGTTPAPVGNGSLPTGTGSRAGTPSFQPAPSSSIQAMYSSPNQPFEDVLLRQRTLGQDIIPSPGQPKRTESLYMPAKMMPPSGMGGGGGGGGGGGAKGKALKSMPINVNLQRKKSLPDAQQAPMLSDAMSREEVSALGSARREEVRRQKEETERLRANPLLYLTSPQVKDWFSRQQLVLLVLIINIALAIMFFKMLT